MALRDCDQRRAVNHHARPQGEDRRDARALADAGLFGAYRRAHRLSDVQRHVHGRLLVRDALVRTRTRYISLIRALLRQKGYRVPSGSAEAFPTRVRGLALPGPLLSLIAPLLAVLRHLNRQLAYADETIERVAAHDERVQRLRTVPSVGPVTAAAFVATIAMSSASQNLSRRGDGTDNGPLIQDPWIITGVHGAELQARE